MDSRGRLIGAAAPVWLSPTPCIAREMRDNKKYLTDYVTISHEDEKYKSFACEILRTCQP